MGHSLGRAQIHRVLAVFYWMLAPPVPEGPLRAIFPPAEASICPSRFRTSTNDVTKIQRRDHGG
jgi:hypothetical protein